MTQESDFNISDAQSPVNIAPEESPQEKITLWGEIIKGWYWVVFILKMMGSFNGVSSLLSSIKKTAIMLIKRLLIQLQPTQNLPLQDSRKDPNE